MGSASIDPLKKQWKGVFAMDKDLKMNLQYFAEEQEEPKGEEPKLKYSDDDVNKIVQEKIAKERAKREAEIEEAKKEAKMTADQKREHELEKVTQAKDEALAKLLHRDLVDTARTKFNEANVDLTTDELELVVGADEDTTNQNIEVVKGMVERLSGQVKDELLKGNTPKAPTKNDIQVTAEQFDAMTSQERMNLAKEQPEVFNKITGGI